MTKKNKSLAHKLKATREDRSMTQQQLADSAGINVGQISHYETGHSRPGLDNLVKLCKALSIPMQDLLEGK